MKKKAKPNVPIRRFKKWTDQELALSREQWCKIKRWALRRKEPPSVEELEWELTNDPGLLLDDIAKLAKRYGIRPVSEAAADWSKSNAHLFGADRMRLPFYP